MSHTIVIQTPIDKGEEISRGCSRDGKVTTPCVEGIQDVIGGPYSVCFYKLFVI